MPVLCRDCHAEWPKGINGDRCPSCQSSRILRHPELNKLTIAHIDCDAFYATVEKRDHPELANRPVLVGGRRRGVVMAACYVARLYGCHSAMPMYQALKMCPDAVVIKPNMTKYGAVGNEVRTLMNEVTPLVEPISIDEAFLDLSGTEKLHQGSPARTLAILVDRITNSIGITASIGLSHNKFLAKVASDLDKPIGFSVIGREETKRFLASKPVSIIWGVGNSLKAKLRRDGITTIEHLQATDEKILISRYGAIGKRLHRLSQGVDERTVSPHTPTKSLSAETTFYENLNETRPLERHLWMLCEKVADRLKNSELAGKRITLKLKTQNFKLLTRSRTLTSPTLLAETMYRAVKPLLSKETDGTHYRLIGISIAELNKASEANPSDLDTLASQKATVEQTIDTVRAKLGKNAIIKGRSLC